MSEGRSGSQSEQLIDETQVYVDKVRGEFLNNGYDASLKPSMADAIIRYWSVLYKYRDETILNEGDFPDVSPVRERIGASINRVVDAPGRRRGKTTSAEPAVNELSGDYMVELSFELDALAKKLGFAPPATDATPHDEIGHDDLEALLQARGQDEALEKIPGGDS